MCSGGEKKIGPISIFTLRKVKKIKIKKVNFLMIEIIFIFTRVNEPQFYLNFIENYKLIVMNFELKLLNILSFRYLFGMAFLPFF